MTLEKGLVSILWERIPQWKRMTVNLSRNFLAATQINNL